MDDSLTLILDGMVTLADLAAAVRDFRDLVDALSSEVGGSEAIEWVVTALEAGSATATVSGRGKSPAGIEAVVGAYERVGESLRAETPFPYSAKVRKPALRLTGHIGPRIESIRLETPRTEALVRKPVFTLPIASVPAVVGELLKAVPLARVIKPDDAFGMVDGYVETLSHRQGLRFVIYDRVFDKSVSCYLDTGSEEIMRDAWGHRARVFGRVRRDVATGRPLSIRGVSRVERIEEGAKGTWRLARGAAPATNDETPEAAIRRMRDA